MQEQKLNVLLSDLVIFSHKIQSFHWYIKGNAFFQVHLKLEEFYDEINEHVDLVAEAMLMDNLHPVSTIKDYTKYAKIEEAKGDYIEIPKAFDILLKDFNYLLDSAKDIKKEADKEENFLLSTKMDDLIGSYSKTIWMLSQAIMK